MIVYVQQQQGTVNINLEVLTIDIRDIHTLNWNIIAQTMFVMSLLKRL